MIVNLGHEWRWSKLAVVIFNSSLNSLFCTYLLSMLRFITRWAQFYFSIFDVSPSDPGTLHPSSFTVFPSSQTSVSALRPSPRHDQILVQKLVCLLQKKLMLLTISMFFFSYFFSLSLSLERSTFGPYRFW